MMGVYGLLLRGLGVLGRSKRGPGERGYEFLLTGTFYSDNWIRSHLRPLACSRYCARVRVVSTYPISPIENVEVIAPWRWLVRAIGGVPARLATFFWIGLRTRPHFVGGFHLLFNGLVATMLAKLIGARSLYFCVGGPAEVLGGGIASENRLFEKLETPDPVVEDQLLRAVKSFDLIVTMGSSAREFFLRHGARAAVEVMSGGLDVRRYSPSRATPTTDLIFVGRLAPIKRLDLFLQIVAILRRQLPTVSAVIVGDGQLRASLEILARELGIADNVRFVGHQANVEAWLQDARIFVLTSDSEGLSLALIEAMLCGVPAVVSHVGDLGDLVDEGVNGHLVRERLADVFATRAQELLQDNERRQRFAQAARSAAVRFDTEVCAQAWDRVLNASQGQTQHAPARFGRS